MKSSIVNQSMNNTLPYPKLMQSSVDNIVIMALSESERDNVIRGTVLIGDEESPVGSHANDWKRSVFQDFQGTVEISNSAEVKPSEE